MFGRFWISHIFRSASEHINAVQKYIDFGSNYAVCQDGILIEIEVAISILLESFTCHWVWVWIRTLKWIRWWCNSVETLSWLGKCRFCPPQIDYLPPDGKIALVIVNIIVPDLVSEESRQWCNPSRWSWKCSHRNPVTVARSRHLDGQARGEWSSNGLLKIKQW